MVGVGAERGCTGRCGGGEGGLLVGVGAERGCTGMCEGGGQTDRELPREGRERTGRMMRCWGIV